jgi:hypothetical protein
VLRASASGMDAETIAGTFGVSRRLGAPVGAASVRAGLIRTAGANQIPRAGWTATVNGWRR